MTLQLKAANELIADLRAKLNEMRHTVQHAETQRALWQKEWEEMKAKLAASERAAAEMRDVLRWIRDRWSRVPPSEAIIDKALSSDAGRDYVPKSEVDAVMQGALVTLEAWAEALGKDPCNNDNYCRLRDFRFNADAGRDYVPLAFHAQEMKDLERERQYVEDKLMQKGDHSLPEAVDRWVNDYVPREKLERAQMGCALVRSLAVVLRANHSPDHQAYKIAQDIDERLAGRGHDYVPKAEVDAAWMNAISQVKARYVLCQNSHENFIVQAIEGGILAARDARKEGDEKMRCNCSDGYAGTAKPPCPVHGSAHQTRPEAAR